jgi:PAS domain S-box-containing protein
MRLDPDSYAVLFDRHPLPMFIADRDTRQIVEVNRAACAHYGWSRDEFVKLSLVDIRPPDDLAAFEAAYAAVTDRTRPYSRVARHRTKSGKVIEVTLEISRVELHGRMHALAVVTDITGVAQLERRFQLLVEHCAEGIALLDEDNTIQYVSPAAERILGAPSSQLVGTRGRGYAHPDDSVPSRSPTTGETREHLTRIRHSDGSWRWIESSTTNLTHDPAVRAYVSNFRDITARKQAEESLRRWQSRLEFLLSATSAITYAARAEGDYGATFVSNNVSAVLGHDPEQFTASSDFWIAGIHPDDRPRVDADLAKLFEAGEATMQYRFRHRDGTYRWIRDSARVSRDAAGTPIEIVGYMHDVTEQREAENAVHRWEANFRALIERAPLAIFVHRAGHFVYLNPAAIQLLGFEHADQIVGTRVLDRVHPGDHEAVAQRMGAIERIGELPPAGGRMIRADGSVFALEGSAIRIDFDGEPATLVMGADVTERDQMLARMALADRMLSAGTLAAGVAHEINNPLAYITATLETVANELPNITIDPRSRLRDTTLHSLIADARDGMARMSAIVRDLRSLSRDDHEPAHPFDVPEVLRVALNMANNEIRHRAQIITAIDRDLPAVNGSATRLGQVFLNLLINAAQAIPDGNIEKNEIRVHARTSPDRAFVSIDVADTGVGIPANVLPRIFDPFFTTKPPGAGTGLGLAISHQIIKSMNGEITVDSRPGRGTTFHVRIPAAASADTPKPRAPGREPTAPLGRLLLVDDEAALGRAITVMLAPDTQVVAVTRGAEALSRIERGERFDAMLCDLMMPDISGIELYERLLTVAPQLAERVVFMTGGAFTDHAHEFLLRLDRPHLSKPFTEEQLRALVTRAMRP